MIDTGIMAQLQVIHTKVEEGIQTLVMADSGEVHTLLQSQWFVVCKLWLACAPQVWCALEEERVDSIVVPASDAEFGVVELR